MHVEVGPVSSASAQAWIAYAADMLVLLRALPSAEVPSGALDAFEALLDEWRPIAQSGERFRWTKDESPEQAKYLMNALFVAGTLIEREAETGKARLRPPEADEFHMMLVQDVLRSLEQQSDSDAHFVKEMRDVWPIARRD